VSFAIISTTVVLIAVFVPLIFIQGIVGKLFTELALTLSFSIIVSAFVALTLSPMLASKYLKITHTKPNFLKKFDNYLEKFSSFYFETLILLLLKKKQIFVFLIGILISVVILFKITPKELIPPEDRGVFFVIIQAPDGSGFEYTKKQSEDIEKIFTADLGKGLYRDVLLRVPGFQSGGDQVNSGFVIVLLENWSKRKKFSGQNLGEIFQKLSSFPGVKAFPIMPQGLRGGAGDKPVQFVIKGNSYEELIRWKEILKSEVTKNKNLVNVDDDLDLTRPQLKIKIDANKAADLGVNIDTIGKTLETMYGSKEVTKYTKDGKEYSVMLQADLKNRQEPSTYTALNRYNRQRAVTISARLVGNYTISEALGYLENIAKEKLPPTARIDYKGESLEYKNTSSDIYFIFILALFTAYLSLAAQFESWRHPLTIMLTVPLAILGGIIGLWIIGSSLNIYSQISLIVLIGLAAKNGILIVEFANQLRQEGMQIKEAIIQSCRVRLRP
ncbi:MAG: efflux RND transporter permease subunit, partial [Candidatus Fonsibacter ubiquis]|nr:efflux RND transporter permease subunit [Candidatus Fonsibacter ubiquis]